MSRGVTLAFKAPSLVSHSRKGKSHTLADDESLVCEILSRVPVKSLMRFKCVCKRWQALIQKDRHFIDLHFTLSKTYRGRVGVGVSSLLIMPHAYRERCLLLAELSTVSENGSSGGAIVHTKIPHVGPRHASFLQPVNGLICFIDTRASCVCIHNPSTRDSSPWIKSVIKQHEDEDNMIQVIDELGDLVVYNVRYINLSWDFGYDPISKEHKVISFWVRQRSNWQLGKSEDWLCEVLTVRQNSWRIINAVPPISPYHLSSAKSVCAGGSIFWLHPGSDEFIDNVTEPMIVEFNVAAENFRVITIPNFIVDDIRLPYDSGNALMEVDGHLVLLAKKIYRSENDIWINNQSTSMKMCILYPEKRNYGSGSTSYAEGINSYYWKEDFFLIPPFDWKQERLDCVVPIPGTDLFVVRSSDACSFYCYNWKKKSFSNKFAVNGFDSFINEDNRYKPFDFRCYAFEENLLPVN